MRSTKESEGEKRIGFVITHKENLEDFNNWLETRYIKKITILEPKLDNYKNKLIIANNFNEGNDLNIKISDIAK